MFYTSEPEALRTFSRDKLGLPPTDVGKGWLIFDLPDAKMGCHPAEREGAKPVASGTPYISFYCDDVHKTKAELSARGVEFTDDVTDQGYGLVTRSTCRATSRSSSTNPATSAIRPHRMARRTPCLTKSQTA